MKKEYTTKEIADYTGKSKSATMRKANNEHWSYQTETIRGGKIRKYPIGTLPEDIRMAIMKNETEEILPILYSAIPAIPPPVIDPALKEWHTRPETCREEARTRLGLVNKARSIKARTKRGKTEALKRYAASQKLSYPSLCRHLKAANQALKSAQAGGRDAIMAQIMALTPNHGNNLGAYRAFDCDAVNYAKKLYTSQAHLNLSDAYTYTLNEASIQGWKAGSYNTLKRIIDKELTASLKTLARQGFRRYQADCELKILRDYREIWPNFMWCGDHHIFDVFVKMPGGKVMRPWVTAWMDMASRSFMGWCISFQPNSRTIALALAHAISEKDDANFPQHGLPWSVYIDNGKDYRSKYLNGEEVKIGNIDYPEIMERFAAMGIDPFYIDLEYDSEQRVWIKKRGNLNHTIKSVRVGGVYARMGIHQRYATAYHPWAKPIERSFRNVVQQFSRSLPGWCGSGHEQRPEKLTWELKRGLVLDFESFCERFYGWVVNRYNKAPHSGHGMDGRSPDEVFMCFGVPEKVDPELLAFALLKKENVKIHNWGFKLLGREFELDIPADLSGAVVLNTAINRFATVLHDPDLKTVRVYVDGEYICNGRRLNRASFIRPDDSVMTNKIKLQAHQRRLNKESLRVIQEEAPAETISAADAILMLTTSQDSDALESTNDSHFADTPRAPAEPREPIPLTEEERYRAIMWKLAAEDTLSETDAQWRDEYEAGAEYQARQQLYEAEFSYMKYQQKRRG